MRDNGVHSYPPAPATWISLWWWRNTATSSPEWMALEAWLSEQFVTIWSVTPLKQDVLALQKDRAGTGRHPRTVLKWPPVSLVFTGSHTPVLVPTLSAPPLRNQHHRFIPASPTATFPTRVKQKDMDPCLFLAAAPWRDCCHFFLKEGWCWAEKQVWSLGS